MTRDVLARKLSSLERYLADLRPHAGKSVEEIRERPYEVERLLELVVQVAVDIVTHELGERGITPESYRAAFVRAGEEGLLPPGLSERLADAAGLRNVLVHMYDTIDYEILASSVDDALADLTAFLDHYRARLEDEDPAG